MHEYTAPVRRRRRRRSCRPIVLAALTTALLLAGCMRLWDQMPEEHRVAAVRMGSGENTAVTEPDMTPPRIIGAGDLVTYAGDSISYLRDVTVTDNRDQAPTVTVDNSEVDLSRPGTYEIVYTAADASGNISRVAALVTVLEKEADFVDMETIDSAADAVLETFLLDGMTVEEQVRAVYSWARNDLNYVNHSDRTDWHQTAYTMLTEGRGDCFGYFAVTKLLFERLGIPNIDVRKVKNSEKDSDHFWSLVSVDGGESYYHFDATPRIGAGDDFCLVTDAFLDTYSDANKGSHNRDKSLYPATPEEPFI